MKTRRGFVSNSSSSSFIIPENSGLLTVNVAAQVFEITRTGNDDCGEPLSEEEIRFDNENNRIKVFFLENKQFDGNILIDWTCNYETWIFRNSTNRICISTCNNVDWSRSCFDDEGVEYLEEGHYYKPHNFIPVKRKFLDLQDMLFKRKSEYDNMTYYNEHAHYKDRIGTNWIDWEDE